MIVKLLAALAISAVPSMANPLPHHYSHGELLAHHSPEDVEPFTNAAMGCMLLGECTDGVDKINTMLDVAVEYPQTDYLPVTAEFNHIIMQLNNIGVEVYLADSKWFVPGNRGVYHTPSNKFYLNRAFMHRTNTLMSVMRHEGWHAAQDCMAGTIDNSLIAIIVPEETVPPIWREIVEKTYPKHAVPWEAEAKWAGVTAGMTTKALDACATGAMWEKYPPTPLTRKYLVDEGFIED